MSYGYYCDLAYGPDFIALRSTAHYTNLKRLNETYTLKGIFTHLGQWIWNSSDIVSDILEAFGFRVKTPTQQKLNPYNKRTLEIYKRNLEAMIFLSQYHKFKIALFLQPILGINGEHPTVEQEKMLEDKDLRVDFYRDARAMFKQMHKMHNEKNKILTKDLSHLLGNHPNLYYDTGHTGSAGNVIIAEEIIASIIKGDML